MREAALRMLTARPAPEPKSENVVWYEETDLGDIDAGQVASR